MISIPLVKTVKYAGLGLPFIAAAGMTAVAGYEAGFIEDQHLRARAPTFMSPSPHPNAYYVTVAAEEPTSPPKGSKVAGAKVVAVTDADPVVSCSVSTECGGGVQNIKKSICETQTCCQIGNTWMTHPDNQTCDDAQDAYYKTKTYVPIPIPPISTSQTTASVMDCSIDGQNVGKMSYIECQSRINEYYKNKPSDCVIDGQVVGRLSSSDCSTVSLEGKQTARYQRQVVQPGLSDCSRWKSIGRVWF